MLETDDDEATGSGRSQRKRKKTFSDVEVDNSDTDYSSAPAQVKHLKHLTHTAPDVPVPAGLLSGGNSFSMLSKFALSLMMHW